MRRQVFGLLVLVLVLLTACTSAPPQTVPQTKLGYFISRLRYQPPPEPTPRPGDYVCLNSFDEHGEDLPGAVVERLTGIKPDGIVGGAPDLLEEARRDVDMVSTGGLAVQSSRTPDGGEVMAVQWCRPYGMTDVFVRSPEGEAWHAVRLDPPGLGSGSVSTTWLDGTLLVTQHEGWLTQVYRLWIAKPSAEGWEVVYEATHRGFSAYGTYDPPEVDRFDENGVDYLRLEYTRDDGMKVDELYRFDSSQLGYVRVEEDDQEGDN